MLSDTSDQWDRMAPSQLISKDLLGQYTKIQAMSRGSEGIGVVAFTYKLSRLYKEKASITR